MVINDILYKLAEQKAIEGDLNFAENLVAIAHKNNKCNFCKKTEALMEKEGKMVCKSCGKDTKCSAKGCDTKKMKGQMKMKDGKPYCSNSCMKNIKKSSSDVLSQMIKKYAHKMKEDIHSGDFEALPGADMAEIDLEQVDLMKLAENLYLNHAHLYHTGEEKDAFKDGIFIGLRGY